MSLVTPAWRDHFMAPGEGRDSSVTPPMAEAREAAWQGRVGALSPAWQEPVGQKGTPQGRGKTCPSRLPQPGAS